MQALQRLAIIVVGAVAVKSFASPNPSVKGLAASTLLAGFAFVMGLSYRRQSEVIMLNELSRLVGLGIQLTEHSVVGSWFSLECKIASFVFPIQALINFSGGAKAETFWRELAPMRPLIVPRFLEHIVAAAFGYPQDFHEFTVMVMPGVYSIFAPLSFAPFLLMVGFFASARLFVLDFLQKAGEGGVPQAPLLNVTDNKPFSLESKAVEDILIQTTICFGFVMAAHLYGYQGRDNQYFSVFVYLFSGAHTLVNSWDDPVTLVFVVACYMVIGTCYIAFLPK